MPKKCIDCKRPATHKFRARDGQIIYTCDKHSKGWLNSTELFSLKTRIIKNKFKLTWALLLITNIAWALFSYTLWGRLPEETVTL